MNKLLWTLQNTTSLTKLIKHWHQWMLLPKEKWCCDPGNGGGGTYGKSESLAIIKCHKHGADAFISQGKIWHMGGCGGAYPLCCEIVASTKTRDNT